MICTKCNINKDIEEFPFRNKQKGTRNTVCRVCQREYTKKYYYLNRDISIERVKNRRKEIETWFRDLKKTFKCSVCGESCWVCLDLHHINPSEKERTVMQLVHRCCSKEMILKELSKCIVVCSNCHRKIHHKNIIE